MPASPHSMDKQAPSSSCSSSKRARSPDEQITRRVRPPPSNHSRPPPPPVSFGQGLGQVQGQSFGSHVRPPSHGLPGKSAWTGLSQQQGYQRPPPYQPPPLGGGGGMPMQRPGGGFRLPAFGPPPVMMSHHSLPRPPTAGFVGLPPRPSQGQKRGPDGHPSARGPKKAKTAGGPSGGSATTAAALPPRPKKPTRDIALAPPLSLDGASSTLMVYIASLYKPHIRKKRPSAEYSYTPAVAAEDPPTTFNCNIVAPVETGLEDSARTASATGTKVDAKQEASRTLLRALWAVGEVDDAYAPIVDPEELAKQTSQGTEGTIPVLVHVPEIWRTCAASDSRTLFPTLIHPPPLPSAAIEANSTSDPGMAKLFPGRPLILLTRVPMPDIASFEIFVGAQPASFRFERFAAVDLGDADLKRVKQFHVGLLRAITNKPVVFEGDGIPFFLAPVDQLWLKSRKASPLPAESEVSGKVKEDPRKKRKKEKASKMKESEGGRGGSPLSAVDAASEAGGGDGQLPPASRAMVDWAEMDLSSEASFVPWKILDDAALDEQAKDAMACGKSEFSRRQKIVALRRDLTPDSSPADSPREAAFASILDYVRANAPKFQELIRADQPLFEIARYPGTIGHVRRHLPAEPNTKSKPSMEQKYLVPELSYCSTFKASTYESALYVPALLSKLDNILTVKDANSKFVRNTIDESLLMEALTAPASGADRNYERLEFIGDSVLKYIVTVYIIASQSQFSERQLHNWRQTFISNASLQSAALRIGLPHYVLSREFNARFWYPLNATVEKPTAMPTDRELKYQEIGDKTCADVVEAILGAAFVQSGIPASFDAAKMLSIDFLNAPDWAALSKMWKEPIPISAFPPHVLEAANRCQKITGYRFKHPSLLCQAILCTSDNLRDFERLEFLGDAVLDIMVVSKCWKRFPGLDPAGLTLLRSAMVSNSTLAAFCVDSGLHEFLLHDSAETTKTLRSYVMRFEAGRAAEVEAAKKEERELGQYWVEIEAPKALGDLVEAIIGAHFVDGGVMGVGSQAFFDGTMQPFLDRHIRGLASVAGHPSKTLTGILHERKCQNFTIYKTVVGDGLFKTEVIVHGTVLAWAIEATQAFSIRKACERALGAIEMRAGLLDGLCSCSR